MLELSHLSFLPPPPPPPAFVKHEIQIIWKRQIPTNKQTLLRVHLCRCASKLKSS